MTYQQRIEIKERYEILLPDIINVSIGNLRRGVSPYIVADWSTLFSPIEHDVWSSIRCIGVPFYPEFPVLSYFIDFANPVLKIGIEADGKEFHDVEVDRKRDNELFKLGWKIFRVTGSECVKVPKELWEIEEREMYYEENIEKELEDYFMNTSEGLVMAIFRYYFRPIEDYKYQQYVIKTLDAHRLIDFEL